MGKNRGPIISARESRRSRARRKMEGERPCSTVSRYPRHTAPRRDVISRARLTRDASAGVCAHDRVYTQVCSYTAILPRYRRVYACARAYIYMRAWLVKRRPKVGLSREVATAASAERCTRNEMLRDSLACTSRARCRVGGEGGEPRGR